MQGEQVNEPVALPAPVVTDSATVKDADFEYVGTSQAEVEKSDPGNEQDRRHNGGPIQYNSIAAVTAAATDIFKRGLNQAADIDGTMTSELAICSCDYVLLGGHLNDLPVVNGIKSNDVDDIWKAIRKRFNDIAKDVGADLSPSCKATIPIAVRAGILASRGHVKVERYSRLASFGDEPTENGSVRRVSAAFNVVQPKFVSSVRIGRKPIVTESDNPKSHMTPLTGEHIKMLFGHFIDGVEVKLDKTGKRVLKREPRQTDPSAEAKKMAAIPEDWGSGEAQQTIADGILDNIARAVAVKQTTGKYTFEQMHTVMLAAGMTMKNIKGPYLLRDQMMHSACWELKSDLDTKLDDDGNPLYEDGTKAKAEK